MMKFIPIFETIMVQLTKLKKVMDKKDYRDLLDKMSHTGTFDERMLNIIEEEKTQRKIK